MPETDQKSEERMRQMFKAMNRFMILMWKARMGRLINIWPAVIGRIMVIKHVGWKSGLERLVPVNYAEVDGEIYCVAAFGDRTHWYRNVMALPEVELWLPGERFPALAQDASDSPRRLLLIREVLIASGFAASTFGGIDPYKIDDEALSELTARYCLVRFLRET
jgi:deazaflavin-dependent oxidoreductase (nitroreductase family)